MQRSLRNHTRKYVGVASLGSNGHIFPLAHWGTILRVDYFFVLTAGSMHRRVVCGMYLALLLFEILYDEQMKILVQYSTVLYGAEETRAACWPGIGCA